jgi:ABC-type dipeptide/oligopeptide/nickel transport system permease subunit
VKRAFRRVRRDHAAIGAGVTFAVIFVCALFARRIAPYTWDTIDLSRINHAPTLDAHHVFGTDQVGRDVFSRTFYGLQTPGEIGLAAAAIATALGIPLGIAAGYYGGWLDASLMRFVDLVLSFPTLMLSLAAIVLFYPVWPHTLILVLGLSTWTIVARVERGTSASTSVSDYVAAARALSASDGQILRRHILPNIGGTVLVAATAVLGQVLLLDATIEFFSYGLPASRWPSLGNLLADVTITGGLGLSGYQQLGWWTWAFPALAFALVLACVNVVGDALDEAFNPLR